MRKVLFLDYDGVVNTPMWTPDGKRCRFNQPSDGSVNNFQAVQWISESCQKFNYDIVVTSTWRLRDNYQECLIAGGLRDSVAILGKTEYLWSQENNYCRGDEIEKYLQDHNDITHYIIVDDEYDFLPHQEKHIIQTNVNTGFTEDDFLKFKNIITRGDDKVS